jgi:hypothetical protein
VIGRIVAGITAALALTLGLPAAAPAQNPIVVSNGMKVEVGYPNQPGSCTLGPVGYDDAGRKIGITAAHCAPAGPARDVNLDEDIPVAVNGVVAGELRFVSSDLAKNDFLVIEFGDDVQLSSNGPGLRVDGLAVGASWLTKDGQATGVTSGPIIAKVNGVFQTWVTAWHGDSGGPAVAKGTTKWMGIVSGMFPSVGPIHIISASNILNYMQAHGAVGTGFEPVNN